MLLTVRNTYLLNLINWGDEKMTELCGPGRNMVWIPNKSNRTFPQIWGSQLWCRNWDSHWNEIWKAVETNPIERFPKFEAHSEAPSSFEEVSWHFVKKKNTQKPIQKWIQMHGRANQSFPPSLVPNKSLNLASTFSASALRGLRHSSQYQKARSKYLFWYWDEGLV